MWYFCKVILYCCIYGQPSSVELNVSNVHQCGLIKFYNPWKTWAHTQERWSICVTHTHTHTHTHTFRCIDHAKIHKYILVFLSHVIFSLCCVSSSLTHSHALTHTHQNLIPLITDLLNQQHNSTGGPPRALLPSPPTQPESEKWRGRKHGMDVLTCENIMEVSLKVKTEDYKVNPGLKTSWSTLILHTHTWCSTILWFMFPSWSSERRGKCGE